LALVPFLWRLLEIVNLRCLLGVFQAQQYRLIEIDVRKSRGVKYNVLIVSIGKQALIEGWVICIAQY